MTFIVFESNTWNNNGSRFLTIKEIDWKKEILSNGKFNIKFLSNLSENGAKNYMQGNYLCYVNSRWRMMRGMDKEDLKINSDY